MKYKALKVVQFDKYYAIGDLINAAVINTDMITKLVRCGVISEVGTTEAPEVPEETEETGVPEVPEVSNEGNADSKSKKSSKR